MKKVVSASALLLALLSISAYRVCATENPSANLFYKSLAPYGKWIDVPVLGKVWRPNFSLTGPRWEPYTHGKWVNTRAGWTFLSKEPWGWATYHYGRWTYMAQYGWVWVPGDKWGPAWVSWLSSTGAGGNYIGWAPDEANADNYVPYQPEPGFFVPAQSFLNSNVANNLISPEQSRALFNSGMVAGTAPSVPFVERETGRRVSRMSIIGRSIGAGGFNSGMTMEGNSLIAYHPAETLPQFMEEHRRHERRVEARRMARERESYRAEMRMLASDYGARNRYGYLRASSYASQRQGNGYGRRTRFARYAVQPPRYYFAQTQTAPRHGAQGYPPHAGRGRR